LPTCNSSSTTGIASVPSCTRAVAADAFAAPAVAGTEVEADAVVVDSGAKSAAWYRW
jgi:hypothetical protein